MKAWLAAAMLLPSATPAATIRYAPLPPPYEGVYQPHGVDEIGMWRDADEDERQLANSPLVIRDEALNGYVKGVLCAAVGADRCKAARVYILRTPVFNATMTPNGTMRVFTGLLLRMRNEAELAAVLGHEFGHFERRHGLSRFKAQRGGTDLLSWATVLTAMAGTYQAQSSLSSMRTSIYGGLFHHQRDSEREADLLGIGYLNASRLRPQAAAQVWQNVMAEATASAAARGLRKPRFDAIAFAASHPPDAERAAYLDALAVPDGAAREDGAARYAQAMAPWLPLFLDDQIKLNDFGGSEYIITLLSAGGWSAPLWLARGDLYRVRGNPRDLVAAADFYAHAVALDPRLAEAQRGLGLSLLKTGHRAEGQAALGRYLALKPEAPDAAMIGMLTKDF
ncbi:M48 family metalloprotease [Sphingomonas sp. KR1UV-12]|uniref:M48 family metalloprotease n=1 Tax=Sphingomonas aurea TaxID=3063994 RepID=A0ABT9ENC6_9SPHN|nr:M48 family metallopeptidase [Sphingomonas sp. KR1UV-12]MDP1028458.1 M48 family metalloprotease [Sphingomonas sp. KR1UV-12]